MRIQINATFQKQNIEGYAYGKNSRDLYAVKSSIERRIGYNIYSLNIDHRNVDGTAQYSGTAAKWNRYANAYDNMGTVTLYL